MAYRPNTAEAQKAREASRRMAAAIRRGSLSRSTLIRWKRNLDWYRARGDRLSLLDFLNEYSFGIESYCRPSSWERAA